MRSRSSLAIAKLAIRLWVENSSQAGFTMPLVLGLGLVMIIVAATTIGRSQSDRTTTSFQRETNRALGVSEAGIIRVKLFLDRHKLLANQNLDRWIDTLNTLPSHRVNCPTIDLVSLKQQAEIFKNREWIDLDSRDRRKGRYRIIDYQYQSGIGKLLLAGEIDTYHNANNSSNSTLAIELPVNSEDAKIAPPALWAETFKLDSNQQIMGQVRATNCPLSRSIDPDGVSGIDRQNIVEIDLQASGEIIADPFTIIPPPKIPPNNAILLPAITSSIELPRSNSSDVPDANHEYHYSIDVDDVTSGYSIKLTDENRIKINVATNQKVNLYLKGNIDLGASQTINVNSTNPNLRIYGSERTLKLIVKDNASITALIHAPFADAQSIHSSSAEPIGGITGAVWVKSWDSATSQSKLPIIQAGNWSDFGVNKTDQPIQLSPTSSWQRVEKQ